MAAANSPRQKMINMMYLVLTALLALNVSAEILKAFHLVEVGLEKSSMNIDNKNGSVMKGIEKYHQDFPTDANGTKIFNDAKQVRQISADYVKYVEDLKVEIIKGADGRKEDSNGDGKTDDEEIVKADDIEHHANMMINNKKGEELRKKLNDTRDKLIAILPKDQQGLIKSDMVTEDGKVEGADQSWESVMFEHTPAAAVVTLLTKLQGDAKNTEAQVLDQLSTLIKGNDFVVDQLAPKVIPTSGTYVTSGGKYTAEVFLAASNSKQEADIKVNGATVKAVNGIGQYEVTASGEGEKEYTAVITAKKPNGETETYTTKAKYTVVPPLAVISATKMNVVYIGLDNPIAVSVPGYAASEVQVSLDPAGAGTLRPDKASGGYILNVNKSAKDIKIVASVKDKTTNAVKRMGEQKYRVRLIPDPIPALGTVEQSGSVAAAQLKAQSVIRAPLKNFAFEGVNYIPYEFQFLMIPKAGGNTVYETAKNTQSLTPAMLGALGRARKGDKIIITQIKVKGPDGVKQLPSPLVFDVQ